MLLHEQIAQHNKEDADFFKEAFTCSVTREPYAVPEDIKRLSTRLCRSYGIRGICDPMYIANVIATELGRGDGQGSFWEANVLKGALHIMSSRADVHGNRYFAFAYTDLATGKVASATHSGGESNLHAAMRELHGWSGTPWRVTQSELPIRQFNRVAKDLPHAGCNPKDLASWIANNLR